MKSARTIFLCLLSIFTLMGFLLASLPVERIIHYLNPFAPDGEISSLTIPLMHSLQSISLISSLALLAAFLAFLLKKDLYPKTRKWINNQQRAIMEDSRQTISVIWKHMHNRELWFDILFVFLIALILRFVGLNRPLKHDEAFTYYVFGRLPMRYAIADYSFPNNHVFHTVLLKISVALLGNTTWAIRLPAFLFGTAAAPLLYLYARYTTHKRITSLLAGGLVALYPYMIYYSTNARGYSILAFLTILGALLVDDMMKHKNRFLWFCFSLTLIAGFWTMPIMLLPAGGLSVWILWLGLRHQHDPAYGKWGWLKYAIASAVFVVLGTLLVYLPVLMYSGIDTLIANPNVVSLPDSEFLPTLADRLKDIGKTWQGNFSIYVLLIAGFMMSLAFIHPDKKVRHSSGVILSLISFLVFYTFMQKPNLWPRVVYYLVPFLLLALAYGLSTLWQWIGHDWKRKPFMVGGILVLTIFSLINAPNYSPVGNKLSGETEQQTQWLANNRQQDQIILIDFPEDMAFSVYSEQYGIPPSAIRWEKPFRGAFIIINKPEKQSVESVIEEHGPEIYFFDLDRVELIIDYPNSALYYVPSNWELVQNAYQ